jgi:hypothetical protein
MNGNLLALDATTGKLLWQYAGAGLFVYSNGPEIVNGVLYGNDGSGEYAFDATTGSELWFYNLNGYDETSDPAVANGWVYFGSGDFNNPDNLIRALEISKIPTPPTITFVPPSGPPAGNNTVNIQGNAFLGATSVMFGSTPAQSFIVYSSTNIEAVAPAGSAETTVDITVTTDDGTSAISAADRYTYSDVAVFWVDPSSGPTAGNNTVYILGYGFTGASNVMFGTTPAVSFAVDDDNDIDAVAPAGSAGTVDITVTTNGETSPTSADDQYTYLSPPIVTNVSPNNGSIDGGIPVTVTGTGFTGTTSVMFGTTSSRFTVISDTEIDTVSPWSWSAGTIDVTVTTPGGTSATSTSDQYTYFSLPIVTGVSPNYGPPARNNTVILMGTGFTGATSVMFGTTSATSFTVNSDTEIDAVAPPAGSDFVDITVTTPGGTSQTSSADMYFYIPLVTTVSPHYGPPAGGNNVTITGVNFSNATSVMFGTTPATSFTVNSDASITAKVPGGYPGTIVPVTVANSAGDSLASIGAQYIYAPTVTGVSPSSGPTTGSYEVLITGEGFLDTTRVMFGTVPSPGYCVFSDEAINAEVPPGSAGTVDVTVNIFNVVNGVTSATSKADQYTYTATIPQPTTEIDTTSIPVTTTLSPSTIVPVSASTTDASIMASWSGVTVTPQPGASSPSITTTTYQNLDPSTLSSYQSAFALQGLAINSVDYVMAVTESGVAVSSGSATITMSVPTSWFDAQGGADNIRVVHTSDSGTTDILTVQSSAADAPSKGYTQLTFTSPNGLSTFTLVSVGSSPSGGSINGTAPSQIVPPDGTVYMGESGLNITLPMGTNSTLAWFNAGAPETSSVPTRTIEIVGQDYPFSIDPVAFTGYTGTWYSWANGSTLSNATPAFNVVDPSIAVSIWDYTENRDVTGSTVPFGDELGFTITSNLANVSQERGVAALGTITATGPAGATSLATLPLASTTTSSGPVWNTGNGTYPAGTYTITASGNLNNMLVNYPIPGKTTSLNETVTLSTTPGAVTPLPVIASVPTASAYRNTTIPFTILGNNFEPGPGNTTVEFRNQSTGVIPTTLTNVTPTRIDGTIAIPANVTTGQWNIQVATADGGVNITMNVFTIANVSKPTITAITPTTTWYRNATVPFLITGTNFEIGQTTVTFSYPSNGTVLNPAGFTVNTVTATTIDGTVVVSPGAPTGAWNVSVTTLDGGTVWKPAAFTVATFPAPSITSVTYPPGNIDTTVLFTITGTNFQTDSTKTNVTIYNDITNTVLPTTLLSITPTTIIGSATVSGSAPAGAYNVNVTTVDGGSAPKPGIFTVGYMAIPTIASLTPVSGYQNTMVNVTVTGTNFEQGTGKTMVAFTNQTTGATLTPSFINVTSPTQINAGITIPSNATTGSYRLDITTVDGGVVSKPGAFTVNVFPAPTITTVAPASANLNSTIYFTVTGQNFQTGSAMTWANFTYGAFNNANITINSVTATSMNGTMVIGLYAPAGKWNLTVTTINGGTSLVKTGAMTVAQFPAPIITSITPATGTKGSPVAFTLAGTNFEPAGTAVTLNEDTSGTVLNTTLISVTPTTIVGNFTIPTNVPASLYRLEVTTKDGGVVSKLQAFTVTYLPLPTITTLTPATGSLNTTIPFTLTGNYFLNGGTVVMLRTVGTTINATPYLTWVNITTIQGSFVIPNTAVTGSYTLYVITTGGGFNSKPGAFTVGTFGKPTITAVTPTTWYRNATVPFQITGTNFEPGLTTVTFAYPSNSTLLNSTVVFNTVTATTINGTVVVPYSAPTGTWNVSVATIDGGTVWKPNAFTVSNFPAPTITSITPVSGFRNTTVSYTITGSNFQPGQTTVVLSNPTSGVLATTFYSLNSSQIVGGFQIPATASVGAWRLNVTTLDGGLTSKPSVFTVSKLPVPSITTFTPSTEYQNTMVSFVISGTNFEPGGLTTVNLTKSGQSNIQTTLTSVYSSSITGTVAIPAGNTIGSWNVNVTTLDGGTGTKSNVISIL